MQLAVLLIVLAPLLLLGVGALIAWLVVRSKRTGAPPHVQPMPPHQPPGHPQQHRGW